MTADLNPSAQCFVAVMNQKPVGFIAVQHFPHPKAKNIKKIHRVVVLPDYQGIGIGKALMNFVAEHYTSKGYRLTITTSHPSINKSLKKPWRLYRSGKVQRPGRTSSLRELKRSNTASRMTCSWEYVK